MHPICTREPDHYFRCLAWLRNKRNWTCEERFSFAGLHLLVLLRRSLYFPLSPHALGGQCRQTVRHSLLPKTIDRPDESGGREREVSWSAIFTAFGGTERGRGRESLKLFSPGNNTPAWQGNGSTNGCNSNLEKARTFPSSHLPLSTSSSSFCTPF